MYRYAQADLLSWFKSKNRKPLIIRGARQVGKSTLVRNFCQENQLTLIELNLEERPLKSLKQQGFPLDDVIREIEIIHKIKINPKKMLLFIDEIQEQPKAINLLRYFYEKKKELAVISAGSLFEAVILQDKIETPVGRVDFYQLGPMTFKEFLLANNDIELLKYLTPSKSKKIPSFIHQELIEKMKIFYIVGGMPAVIATYIDTKNLLEAQKVQHQLIETYKNDFYKYVSQSKIPKLDMVFDYAPLHLGKKVKYTEISRDFKAQDLKTAIQILSAAKIIAPVYFTKANKIPIKSEIDLSIFKIFFLDIGLCSKINNISLETFDNEKFSHYLQGDLAEQFTFQHLYYGHGKFEHAEIYYWLNEKKNAAAELDFLIEDERRIIPIEVKAKASNHLKSLIYFMHLNKLSLACKISTAPFAKEKIKTKLYDGTKNVNLNFELISLPLYLVENLRVYLKNKNY